MNYYLFFTLIILLSGFSLWLGKKASVGMKTTEDYFLMGRKLPLFALIMTLLATQVGGGALMGAAEEAYTRGWSVLFYPLGMVIGLLILGLGYGAKIRKLNLTTVAEIFEKSYGSPSLRQIASFISIASLFFILVGQGIAARKFFVALGLNETYLFVGFWMVLILYTVMGGLKAVVNTDILQAGFILVALSIAFLATSNSPQILAENLSQPIQKVSTPTPWMTWLLMPLLFMLIEQDMGQRCFAAKSPRTVSIAATLAAILLLFVSLVPIYFGVTAANAGVTIKEGSSVLITAAQVLTNPTVATLVIVAILMAIVSTADSLLCSISSNISYDFPKLRTTVFISKVMTFFVGLATLFLAFIFDNVVSMLMFSYELAVSVLFVPTTMAVFMKSPSKRSAIISMSLGAVSFVTFLKFTPPIPKEVLTLLISLSGFMVSEWLKKEIPQKEVSLRKED